MKVIDTFPFNGDWVIKMRLEYMYPHVDEFVITESWYTFSGVKKEFLYKDKWADLWKPYEDKIHWVILEDYPPMTVEWENAYKRHAWFHEESKPCWFREHYQRDVAYQHIRERHPGEDYILHVGDVDEIPKVDIFHPDARDTMHQKLMEIKQPLYLEMMFFYYNFYWRKPYHWYRAYIISNHQLQEKPSLTFWRINHLPSLVLREAGWHFSYFMEIADIQRKVQSFSHREYKEYTDLNHIKECIAQGKDLFNRGKEEHLLQEDVDVCLPEIISSFRGELDFLQLS